MYDKIYLKIIVMFTLFTILLVPTSVFAKESTTYSNTTSATSKQVDVVENPDSYKPKTDDSAKLKSTGKKILAIINIVGVVVSVVALGIIGLRYMFGSLEEKAHYKETMVPYIIGLVMLGGITTIVNIIYNIASNI